MVCRGSSGLGLKMCWRAGGNGSQSGVQHLVACGGSAVPVPCRRSVRDLPERFGYFRVAPTISRVELRVGVAAGARAFGRDGRQRVRHD